MPFSAKEASMALIQENILHDRLAACDAAAVETVRAGQGGPFAASLHVYDAATQQMIDVAGPSGNAVLETGLASAHAEDRVIAPQNVVKLKEALRAVGLDNAHVYLVSSAESCPACHTKLEILARQLLQQKLLKPECFTVVYGASYEDSEAVAGFNDAPYHEDFQKIPGTGLVHQRVVKLMEMPTMLRTKMVDVAAPIALIATKDRVLVGTGDSPEISAIHFASAMQKRAGIEAPWNLRGATLYSLTPDIGPMAYAECQWANVAHWVTVDHPDGKLFATHESPGISNGDLFRIIATRPYTNPASALNFLHLTPFANLAQHEWRNRPDLQRYNGI